MPASRYYAILTYCSRCIIIIIIIFQPVAVESLGPINASGRVFLSKLGRKLADQSGDDREISFLFQRLSVLIQRYNAILLHDYFVKEEEE